MRILLLASGYNGLCQRAHLELEALGHEVSIELALSERLMREAVASYQPDLIICPFLKARIPSDIWQNELCIIVHPGIKGDRGASSLDWAIMEDEKEWGVTALQAVEEMDAGDIWATSNFKMRQASKASIYRGEVTEAGIKVILETVKRFEGGAFVPEVLDYSKKEVRGTLRPLMKQKNRAIDWSSDTVESIIRKINAADSFPGVRDTIYGQPYYLYGAHEEESLRGEHPGEIIAQRQGAICRAAVDGAVWISHLKKRKRGKQTFFKLPAAMVLGDKLNDVPESAIDLLYTGSPNSYKEIWYEEKNDVGYLHFDFYNGAMSTEQCQRLREAFLAARKRPTKVIVLVGSKDFWSNGIHLNVIEAAARAGGSQAAAAESWRNINAIDDLIHAIITTDTHLTMSAVQGNAGAGGVILALATDLVYMRSGVVLNPHYKTMALYGSEYWTYLLPKRVGERKAIELTENCLPISAQQAKAIGMIDHILPRETFHQEINRIAHRLAHHPDYEQHLSRKNEERQRDEQIKALADYRTEELAQMRLNFYGPDQSYHQARFNFVYKVPPKNTHLRLAKHRQVI